MKEHKHIDRIFQERFRDFEATPPNNVWKNIERHTQNKPTKISQYNWLWFSTIAASLALLFIFKNPFGMYSPKAINLKHTDFEIVDVNQVNDNEKSSVKIQNIELKQPIKVKNQKSKIPLISSTKKYNKPTEVASITKQNIAIPVEEKTHKNRPKQYWNTSTMTTPIFLSSLNHRNLNNNLPQTYNTTNKISFEVKVPYKENKRFSIQSGLQMVDYAYIPTRFDDNVTSEGSIEKVNTNTAMASVPPNNNISTTVAYQNNQEIIPKETNIIRTANTIETEKQVVNTLPKVSHLTQVIGYVEIPIEVKYQLNSRRDSYDINLIGGFSTMLLSKNEVLLDNKTYPDIVHPNNINSYNFSGNLGVEFQYNIYKNLGFNVSPMLKVYTHTLNQDRVLIPYTIGIYSGLNFRF